MAECINRLRVFWLTYEPQQLLPIIKPVKVSHKKERSYPQLWLGSDRATVVYLLMGICQEGVGRENLDGV